MECAGGSHGRIDARDALDDDAKVGGGAESARGRGACGGVKAVGGAGMAGDALNAPPSNRMLASGRGPGPSHRLGDPSSDLHRWDANDGPGIALATLQDRLRNVVAVATSALGRVARAHPVAAIVKELAGKQGVRVLARACSVLGMLCEQALELGCARRRRE